MQPVNDDMDPIFRQAAQEYPLSTGGADFNKVLQRMQASEENNVLPKKERRHRYLWLLLLLIPFPFVCNYYYSNNGNITRVTPNQASDKTVSKQTPTPNQQPNTSTEQYTSGKEAITTPNQEQNTNKTPSTNTNQLVENNTTNQNHLPTENTTNNNTLASNNASRNLHNQYNKKAASTVWAATKNKQKAITTFNEHTQLTIGNDKKKSKSSTALEGSYTSTNSNMPLQDETAITLKSTTPIINNNNSDTSTLIKDSTHPVAASTQPDTAGAAMAKKASAKDSTSSDITTTAKKQQKSKEQFKPFLYTGVVAGPDYSVVKSTQTAGTGYNVGLVAGYRFNKHLAVEAGIMWSYKKYYADSQYIKTDKMELPSRYIQVLNIDGSCGMFEIPINVQYHFSSKGNGHWYALAGLSSYIMKKEEYYYLYKRYNVQYYAEKEYSNSTKNWFSILQLGGGYQWQLGKRSILRVEPYVKLPVGKIGVAQLPLSSTGLNIGYTVPF